MAFIELHADLSKVAKSLERIADALDRAIPKYEEGTAKSDLNDIEQLEPKKAASEDWEAYAPRKNYY